MFASAAPASPNKRRGKLPFAEARPRQSFPFVAAHAIVAGVGDPAVLWDAPWDALAASESKS
jgi:hypothetical protein